MNINSNISALIHKVENHYGKSNILNSKYLIIKRECGNSPLGLFAYYITNLAWIEYAISHQMIPIIDMKNYVNTYHGKTDVGKVNTWELFFKQPCEVDLESALNSNKARYVWQDIPDFHPNASLDFMCNDAIVSHYHQIANKYVCFTPRVLQTLQKKEQEILEPYKSERILGVLARGTDYTHVQPYYHAIQPDSKMLAEVIDKHCSRYRCNKIYIATEDAEILENMIEIYGDRLLYTNQKRVRDVSGYLNENKAFSERDSFDRGIEYLESIFLLSKCNGIVAGRTSGTVGACIMANNYEFKYFFALGNYGIEDKIMERSHVDVI